MIADSLQAISLIASGFSTLSIPMKIAAMAISFLGINLLSRKFEKDADMGACHYVSAEEIGEAVYMFDFEAENNQLYRELFPTLPIFARCLLPLMNISGMLDYHPSFTTRIDYLKKEYYKKPLPPISIQIAGTAQPIRMSADISKTLSEMIKNSDKENSLLGISTIILHPEREKDNLEFSFSTSSSTSLTFDISPEILQKFLRANAEDKTSHLLQLVDEALKNPHYISLLLEFPTMNAEEIINNLKETVKKLPSYDASKLRYTQDGGKLIVLIPKKTD